MGKSEECMKSFYQPFPSDYPEFFVSDGVQKFAEEWGYFWLLKKIALEQSSAKIKNNRHLKDLLLWKLYVDFDLDTYLIAETPENKVIYAQDFPDYALPIGYTELHLELVSPVDKKKGWYFCYLPSEYLGRKEENA